MNFGRSSRTFSLKLNQKHRTNRTNSIAVSWGCNEPPQHKPLGAGAHSRMHIVNTVENSFLIVMLCPWDSSDIISISVSLIIRVEDSKLVFETMRIR